MAFKCAKGFLLAIEVPIMDKYYDQLVITLMSLKSHFGTLCPDPVLPIPPCLCVEPISIFVCKAEDSSKQI